MKFDTQRPYTASYLVVRNEKNEVAFLLRKNTAWMDGHYSLPAGKVEQGESFTQTAIREAKEEIGIDIVEEDLHHLVTVHRRSHDSDEENMTWVDAFFVVKNYTGQLHNAEPEIHEEIAWFSVDNLPDKLTPPIKQAFLAASQGKAHTEHGWE